MFRSLVPLLLLPAVAAAQPKIDPAQPVPVDPAVLKQIEAKRKELAAAVEGLPKVPDPAIRLDVEVYLKAVEWQVRHGEFYGKEPWKQTLTVLDAGLARAKAADTAPWRAVRGRPVAYGYQSKVDGSVQPFSVTLPENFDPSKPWRLDVVLHGRDATLTETKFLAQREAAKPGKGPDHAVLEVYGRGNNAYRWAGETDVFEAVAAFGNGVGWRWKQPSDVVLRGFSMGGAGTWHIGLHHPFRFSAIGPGAGFTTTRGYIKNLPAKLPEYVERCLHIYDAADYAENAYHVPVVAYSGEKDGQKAAADNIERALKGFKDPLRFTHLVAPGLEHKQPPEWVAKQEAEFRKHLPRAEHAPDRVRAVTYTTAYHEFGWMKFDALDRHYDRAVFDGTWDQTGVRVTTTNVRAFTLVGRDRREMPDAVTINGQAVPVPHQFRGRDKTVLARKAADGRWIADTSPLGWRIELSRRPEKTHGQSGPIDDAFRGPVHAEPPEAANAWFPAVTAAAGGRLETFAADWDRFFRGRFPRSGRELQVPGASRVLFGDPGSNWRIAELLPRLPIKWTKAELVVNGVTYDPKTHFPVLIYPNGTAYDVINSGHTFSAADLKGTNANLYPRLGDWAVLKLAPTANDPHATEVVAAGLFDEFWQFPK